MRKSWKEIQQIMADDRFPLSVKYDLRWILDNAMGSHCLWLQEAMAWEMHLEPGTKVLDIGCGKAIGSVFLAAEYGVQVWATDLKADCNDNWARVQEKGLEGWVYPIRADAGALPYPDSFFDAMVSVNSLFFYATGKDYLREHVLRSIRPGGEIGVIVPSFMREYDRQTLPESYRPYADMYGLWGWHTADWWACHLEDTGLAEVLVADNIPGKDGAELGREIYRKSVWIFNAQEEPFNRLAGDNITFSRIIARRR